MKIALEKEQKMNNIRIKESAARYMGPYQQALEAAQAEQAMFLGNLVLGALDRVRGLMRRIASPAGGPLVLSAVARIGQ